MTPHDPVDTVMHALSSAEPAAGFEARMQTAVLNAAQAPRRSMVARFVARTAGARSLALVSAAVCAVILVAAGIGIVHQKRVPAHRTQYAPQAATAQPIAPLVPQQAPVLAAVPPASARTHRVLRTRAAMQQVSLPLDPAQHVNLPPPPLPLTEQERLVLRMMHRDRSPQLAVLNEDTRARSLHDDAQTYRAFFAPRPPLDGQPIYIQPSSGDTQ